MDFEKSPWQKINKVLTVAAAVILLVWVWKRLGTESEGVRRSIGDRPLTFGGMFSIGTAVACCGYLLWRFLDWLFWRKYFSGKPPPDEPRK